MRTAGELASTVLSTKAGAPGHPGTGGWGQSRGQAGPEGRGDEKGQQPGQEHVFWDENRQ